MDDEQSPHSSRRAYLATVSLGLVAGCTSAEETPPGIGELALSNRTESAVTAALTFQQDDQEESTQVDVPSAGNGGFEPQSITEPWMGDHGSWELVVEAGGLRREYSSESFDERFYDYDETDCLLLDVRIQADSIDITPRTVAVECP